MRRAPGLALILVLLLSMFGGAAVTLAADPEISGRRSVDDRFEGQRLAQPGSEVQGSRPSVLDASLLSARGVRQVVVRLTEEPVSEVAATGASANAQRQAFNEVKAQQDAFVGAAAGTVLARTEIALNAVVLEVDAAQLDELAANPNVVSISPVIDYELGLDETVPYIGATELHEGDPSITGAGVTVAVLDSGVDYTHVAFGDLATVLTYDDAYGEDTADEANKVEPDWAQIADHTNIVGGFDFVGETWPNGTVRPDPDPIDCGGKDVSPDPGTPPDPDALCEGGHGTHVSDIIGGINGVAPGVELYSVKVCSAVSTSCSGVALLLGMDFALDPNADGSTDDHVDVINMSLGSPYGQASDDDLSQAVENATDARRPDRRLGRQQLGQALRHGCAGCRPDGAVGRTDRRAERDPAAPRDRGAGRQRWPLSGGLPAVVRAARSRRSAPRQAAAVRQRCRGQPQRLRGVHARLADGPRRPRRSRRLRLQPEDREHLRRWSRCRHHRPDRPGRALRGSPGCLPG